MNEILFCQLMTCATIEALCLFSIEANSIFSTDNIIILYVLLSVVLTTYILCYLSETITQNLLDTGDIFYQSPWFLLPIKQQMFFVVPIKRSQKVFHLKGLGFINCSSRVFFVGKRTSSGIQCNTASSLLDL